MPKIDFAETGLVSDPAAGVYTQDGLKEFYDASAIGTALDTTFTASFMFGENANTEYPLSFRRSGWSEDQKANIYADGKVELCKERNGAVETFEGAAFVPGTWYYLEYTAANIYSDEELQVWAGYRLILTITDKADYNVEYALDMPEEALAATDLEYDTGNFYMWIPAEIKGNISVASFLYDPTATPSEPEMPEDIYTKDILSMPKIDFSAVGLITDPRTDVYTDTGLKEFYEGNAPGTTLDTTFTAAVMFREGANTGYPVSFRRSGWNEGLKLNFYPDGRVRLYKADADIEANWKEFAGDAFVPNTWYYIEYTVANLYSDAALQTQIGYRSQVTVTDKAEYSVSYTYDFLNSETDNNTYDTGNFFIWVASELSGSFGVASYSYDPNAVATGYHPAVDVDEAPVIEISDKVAMNADGFLLSDYTEEADGYYANFSQDLGNGVYELNKTLRYKMQGSGSFHTAYAGDWIWNSYKVDFDYGANTVTVGMGSSNTEVVTPSPALDEDTVYLMEITIVEFFRDDDNTKAYEMLYVRIYIDGEDAPFFDKAYQYINPIIPVTGARDYVGFYMGKEGNSLRVMPADFSREYAVTLVNGDSSNQVKTSYGDAYDFTAYEQEKKGYTFAGWQYYVGGEGKTIPSSGIWTVDFTAQSAGIYNGTLTAVYTPIEYKVNYVVTGGTNSAENPSAINAEDGTVALAAPEPAEEGKVFFGWYLSSDFSGEPVTEIECTYADITLYAKIAEGCTLTLILPNGEEMSVPAELNAVYTFPKQTSEGYGEITGWQKKEGDSWTDVGGMSITPAGDAVYRAVAQPIEYGITYELDGGTNSAENPATYTVKDSITLLNPEKEGYFFVGWYIGEENVRGIALGTTGAVTIRARWAEDTLPEKTEYAAGENAVLLPVPGGLPAGAHYNVSLFDAQNNELPVVSNSYTFSEAGNYRLVYSITLPSGTYTREMQVVVTAEQGDNEDPAPGPEPSPEEGGCSGSAAGISLALALPVLAGAVAVLAVRKKNSGQ